MSFFQRLPHRLAGDVGEATQGDQPVGQQLQGPTATPRGRVTAGQSDQVLLHLPSDLDLVGSRGPWPGMDGRFQTLGHEPPSHANDGRGAGLQRVDDLFIRAAGSARPVVGQEEDPGMDQLACRGLAEGDHPIQYLTLLDGQGHLVLLHWGTPCLGPESSHRLKESRSPSNLSIKREFQAD
jgi:hypothetical protein